MKMKKKENYERDYEKLTCLIVIMLWNLDAEAGLEDFLVDAVRRGFSHTFYPRYPSHTISDANPRCRRRRGSCVETCAVIGG
jgi:hypothetical protein